MCFSGGAESTYVELSCGIKGLEGSATGASMSIDMVKLDCLYPQRSCNLDTVFDSLENSGRIHRAGVVTFLKIVKRS